MVTTVGGLFPSHPATEGPIDCRKQSVPEITVAELFVATAALKPGKAPGPDGIPGEIHRPIANIKPENVQHVSRKDPFLDRTYGTYSRI